MISVPGLVCRGCGSGDLSLGWTTAAVPVSPEVPGRGRVPVRVEVTVRVDGYCRACHAWTCGSMRGVRLLADSFRGGEFVPDPGPAAAA